MKLNPKHWIILWREPWRRTFWTAFYQFRRENGEAKRWDIALTENDVVFDIGGFEGNWAADIHHRFGCTVHVFEPHPTFAAAIEARFADNPKIVVHDVALGSSDGVLTLSDAGDASSAVSGVQGDIKGRVVDAAVFMAAFEGDVALAKINIEGGEYDLMPALANARVLDRFRVFQIQFHLYAEANKAERDTIRAELSKAHRCDWEYPFVWEQWSLPK